MHIRRFLVLCVFVLGACSAGARFSDATAADATPMAQAARFIQDIGSRAIGALSDQSLSQAQREDKVRTLLGEGLDLPRIGRFALGRFWQSASDAQRAEYSKLFDEYVLNTYSRRLSAYSGETFKVLGAQPIADTDALVLTEIVRPNNPPLNTGWRVRLDNGKLKVVDVVVEGVSMALTQRQEFSSVIQNKGLDGLLDSMRAQNQQFATSGSGAPPAK